MELIQEKLTSLEIHLKYPAKSVLKTAILEDVACGMYPCYYLIKDGYIETSTSVISLIRSTGNFEHNTKFKPNLLKNNFYESTNSIDKRINKLSAFQVVTTKSQTINFEPTTKINNIETFVSSSVQHYISFVQKIESRFPEYQQVILTGGIDSLLINLVPKLNHKQWHIFSSEPNTNIVKKFMETNSLSINQFFTHDNINDEDLINVFEKVVNTDCYVNPAHYRWMKSLSNIYNQFQGKCIFWTGSIGDAINAHNELYARYYYKYYFETHFNRAARWQGMSHQLCKNLVGAPLLSIYHSPEIWESLYQHFDHRLCFKKDLRKEIGELLAQKRLEWPTENPGPAAWSLDNKFVNLLLPFYKKYIENEIT